MFLMPYNKWARLLAYVTAFGPKTQVIAFPRSSLARPVQDRRRRGAPFKTGGFQGINDRRFNDLEMSWPRFIRANQGYIGAGTRETQRLQAPIDIEFSRAACFAKPDWHFLAGEYGWPTIPFKSSDPALIYGLIWP